jgi:hypothetical protein
MNDVDLSTVTDMNALKVMAYDAISAFEKTRATLEAINRRIAEVEAAPITGDTASEENASS